MRTYSGPEITEILQNKASDLARLSSKIVLNNKDALNDDEQVISSMMLQIGDALQEIFPDMSYSNLSQISSFLLHENLEILSRWGEKEQEMGKIPT